MREALADLCHRQWSGWINYMFNKCVPTMDGGLIIPPEYVDRWRRQMMTSYKELSPDEQGSDRREADKFIQLFKEYNDRVS